LDIVKVIVFFILLILAAYFDVKNNQIPNRITLPVTVFGFILGALDSGFSGLFSAALGFLTGFLPCFFLFRLNGLGGGDVKLMGAVGTLAGTKFVLFTLWYSSLIGFTIALFILIKNRQLINGLKKSYYLILSIFIKQKSVENYSNDEKKSLTIPYGIAIVTGAYISFFTLCL